jgi:hypothetical protein
VRVRSYRTSGRDLRAGQASGGSELIVNVQQYLTKLSNDSTIYRARRTSRVYVLRNISSQPELMGMQKVENEFGDERRGLW